MSDLDKSPEQIAKETSEAAITAGYCPDYGTSFWEEAIVGIITRERDARTKIEALINRPEIDDFMKAISLEAAHQKKRWGGNHDKLKTPEDWLWVVAYLSTKATQAARYGDKSKYLHHIITTAALCANWFEAVKEGGT